MKGRKMMKKKRMVTLLLITFTVATLLTGCGSNETDSEYNNSQKENTSVIDKQTEERTELSREEIDEIVKQFLLSYEPVPSLEMYGFTFAPSDDPYFRNYAYSWCGEMPIIIVQTGYNEINSQAEGITDCVFFSVDKTTGEIIELQRPACFEYVEHSFRFYAGEEGLVIEKNYWPDESNTYYLEKISADTNEWIENGLNLDQGQSFVNNGSFQPMEYSMIASLTATEGADEEKIRTFLNGYTPEATFDVYELKGYPATVYIYRADLGVQYVSFAAGQCNVLVVATPYSATAESSFISYKYEVYYYDEAGATYKLFDNQPDTTHDEEAYPTEYNFDIVANNDGISNTFTFIKGGTRIAVEIDRTALHWEYQHMMAGGNFDFLEWKK